jgi:hypothetical protein
MALRRRTSLDVGYGLTNALTGLAPQPIIANRAPTTSDTAPLGTVWVYTAADEAYILTSVANASASWEAVTGGAGVFSSLTVNPGPVNMLTDTATATGNFGTGAGVKTINIGSSDTTSQTTIYGGPTGGVDINAQQVSIGSGIGDNIGIGGVLGNSTTAIYASGTGNLTLSAVNCTLDIDSGTGVMGISTDASATTVNVATGAAVKTLTVGSTNTTSATTVQAGTGGLALSSAGLTTLVSTTPTAASPTAGVTSNVNVIGATFTGFTTASSASQTFTITSSKILATSAVFVTVTNSSAGNDCFLGITGIVQAVGSIAVHTLNSGSQALDGTVYVNVWIIS